jgi:hypothetical protein
MRFYCTLVSDDCDGINLITKIAENIKPFATRKLLWDDTM